MGQCILMILLGVLLTVLGVSNLRGSIASIHWYHRQKVSKQDRRAYARAMGTGTVIPGASLVLTGILQAVVPAEFWFWILAAGLAVGLGFLLYGQFRSNGGLF